MRAWRKIKRPSPSTVVFSILALPFLAWPCWLLWFHLLRCGPTYYSAGYSESKFLGLREGMSSREVEALLGRPLGRIPQGDGTVLWTYSDRDDCTCDFEMRWVYIGRGRVKSMANMHWYE